MKGFDESLENPNDYWIESKFLVFQKVQDHAHQAMLHFFSPTLPELGIRSFFVSIIIIGLLFIQHLMFPFCRHGFVVISPCFQSRVKNANTSYSMIYHLRLETSGH